MRLGLLVSRSGPAGLWGPSCDAGAMLAAAEINTAGGVLGKAVELIVADAGWTLGEATANAAGLVDIHEADAVVGMHPSNVRAAVQRGLSGRVPYIYTPQYEGGERDPSILLTGATDDELLAPAIAWLSEHRRARRFFFVGNDYVWPRTAHGMAGGMVVGAAGELVGSAFLPFGMEDHSDVLEQIRAARPDAVIMMLLGLEAVRFNRAFSEAGLARRVLRLGLAVDETVLYAIGPERSENLYAVLNYFSHIHSPANDRFRETYHDCFGDYAPPISIVCQSCYEGVHVAANLARAAGRSDAGSLARRLRRPVARKALRSGLANMAMGPTLRVHLAIAEGVEFRVVATH